MSSLLVQRTCTIAMSGHASSLLEFGGPRVSGRPGSEARGCAVGGFGGDGQQRRNAPRSVHMRCASSMGAGKPGGMASQRCTRVDAHSSTSLSALSTATSMPLKRCSRIVLTGALRGPVPPWPMSAGVRTLPSMLPCASAAVVCGTDSRPVAPCAASRSRCGPHRPSSACASCSTLSSTTMRHRGGGCCSATAWDRLVLDGGTSPSSVIQIRQSQGTLLGRTRGIAVRYRALHGQMIQSLKTQRAVLCKNAKLCIPTTGASSFKSLRT